MNLTKLLKVVFVLVLLTISNAFATTFYVNNQIGSDGYNGQYETYQGGINGPKLTLKNAIDAAINNDIIYIAATPLLYDEPGITINKILHLRTTGGNPEFQNVWKVDFGGTNPAGVEVYFEGSNNIQLDGGLELLCGDVTGGQFLVVGNHVTRDVKGSVTGQLGYTTPGTVTFNYQGTATAPNYLTTGDEIPSATVNASAIGNFNTAANTELQLTKDLTVNGTITTSDVLNLSTFVLKYAGSVSPVTHTFGGNVIAGTGGLLKIDNGNAAIVSLTGAAVNLPNIEIVTGKNTGRTVNITTLGKIGDLTVSGTYQNVNVNGPVEADNVTTTSSGTGTYGLVDLVTPLTVDNLTVGTADVAAMGKIRVRVATTINSITNYGKTIFSVDNVGAVTFSGGAVLYNRTGNIYVETAADVTINNDVVLGTKLTSSVTAPASGTASGDAIGSIYFAGGKVYVKGSVKNNLDYTFTYNASNIGANVFYVDGLGRIQFPDAQVKIDGNVENNAKFTGTLTAVAGSTAGAQNNGEIIFTALANATVFSSGSQIINNVNATITESSAGSTRFVQNGRIWFMANNVANTYPAITNKIIQNSGARNSGSIIFDANALNVIVASVTNNSDVGSKQKNAAGGWWDESGTIWFKDGAAGTVTVNGDVVSADLESTDKGGDIRFPNTSFSAQKVENTRANSYSDILVGPTTSVGNAGATFSATSINNTGKGWIQIFAPSTANAVVAGSVVNKGTGRIEFPNLASGSFSSKSMRIENGQVNLNALTSGSFSVVNTNKSGSLEIIGGTLSIGNATAGTPPAAPKLTTGDVNLDNFTISGGIFRVNAVVAPDPSAGVNIIDISNEAKLLAGTLDVYGIEQILYHGYKLQIGDVTTKPTFTNEQYIPTDLTLWEPIPNITQDMYIGKTKPEWDGTLTIANGANIPEVVNIHSVEPVDLTAPPILIVNNTVTFATALVPNSIILKDNVRIQVGKNDNPGSVGNFVNNSGYKTEGDARVVLGGNGLQTVNFGAAPVVFGGFEVDNSGAANPTVAFGAAGASFTDKFYLTQGIVDGANVVFNGNLVSPNTVPMIIRNNGSFNAVPTFTSMVDVTYIGNDQITALELPTVDKLRNLSVETTNSMNPSAGAHATVKILPAVTPATIIVNGTLNVNPGQGLNIENNVVLQLKGTTVTLGAGSILGNTGTGVLSLAGSGTTLTGGVGSFLPPIQIADGSVGNKIIGFAGLVNEYFGGDGLFFKDVAPYLNNTTDDPTTDGSLTYLDAAPLNAGNSSLAVNFEQNFAGTPAVQVPDLLSITTSKPGDTFTLENNVLATGLLTHNGGNIDVANFTLELNNTTAAPAIHQLDGSDATITGAGTLKITGDKDVSLDLNNANATIGVGNFYVNLINTVPNPDVPMDLEVQDFNLTLTGNVNVVAGNLWLGNSVPTARNITVTGSALTLEAQGTIPGTGTLILNPTVPPLAFSYYGDPLISNLTVLGDVNLLGTGASLTIAMPIPGSGTFRHDAGVFNFGTRLLKVGAGGTFIHNGGSYEATTGVFEFSGNTFTKTASFSIPNFKYSAGDVRVNAAANPTAAVNAVMTVTKNLILAGGTFNHDSDADDAPVDEVLPTLTVDNDVLVTYVSGTVVPQPTYVNTIDLLVQNVGPLLLPANVWPATPLTLVDLFTVNNGATTITMPSGVRQVNVAGAVTSGTIIVPQQSTSPVVVPVSNLVLVENAPFAINGVVTIQGSGVNLAAGVVTLGNKSLLTLTAGGINGAGLLHYGTEQNVRVIAGTITGVTRTDNSDANITYAVNAAYGSAQELPGTVNNLTFTRTNNVVNAATTLNTPVNVIGKLTIKNDLTAVNQVSVAGNVEIANESADFSNATDPVVDFQNSLRFYLANNQDLTLINGSVFAVNNVIIDKTNASNTVTIKDQDADVTTTVTFSVTNLLTFRNGLFVTNENMIKLNTPAFPDPSQGFDRTAVTGTRISHIVGNVARQTINNGNPLFPVYSYPTLVFPVGTPTYYRPSIMTFNAANSGLNSIPNTTFIVNHTPEYPQGSEGLPLGDIARYPNFYWSIQTTGYVSPSITFDMQLEAPGLAPAEYFNNVADIRLIRHLGAVADENNPWVLQGPSTIQYDNADIGGVAKVIVRGALFGLMTDKTVFTFGLKTKLVEANPIADKVFTIGDAASVDKLTGVITGATGTLTYTLTETDPLNAFIATIVDDTLRITPLAVGSGKVAIKVKDSNGDYITVEVNVAVNAPTEFAVNGKVTYDNAGSTPLAGVTVTLGSLTATTDATGAYSFPVVPNGTYNLTASSTATWAGANATDALAVANHFAGINVLAGLKLEAGDVNNSTIANNTDALLILRRFADPTVTFVKGDWVYTSGNITVSGANQTVDLKGLAVGDVNGSNTPTLAKAISTQYTTDGTLKVNPKEVFELPVKVATEMNVSAISLRFNYQADLVAFEGAVSKAGNIISYDNKKGTVTLAWADMSGKEALALKADEAIVTLKFKPTDNFKAGSKLDVTLDNTVSELATKEGNVINATLKASAVEAYVPTEFALKQNYPNPFNPSTTIQYELPVDSRVSLVIFNSLGEQVTTLVNELQGAGVYKFNFNADNLTSGIYFYRLHVEGGERNFTQTQKMILMK